MSYTDSVNSRKVRRIDAVGRVHVIAWLTSVADIVIILTVVAVELDADFYEVSQGVDPVAQRKLRLFYAVGQIDVEGWFTDETNIIVEFTIKTAWVKAVLSIDANDSN